MSVKVLFRSLGHEDGAASHQEFDMKEVSIVDEPADHVLKSVSVTENGLPAAPLPGERWNALSQYRQRTGKVGHATLPCIYCGSRPGNTRDHVPPRSFFPSPFPQDLLTVPSCKECNAKFSKDEEYVRTILASSWDRENEDTPARTLFDTKVRRALEYSGPLLRRVADSMKLVEIRTPAGIYLGRRPAFLLDMPRFKRVMEKIARGLHYCETGIFLPPGVKCAVEYNPDPEAYDEIIDALGDIKSNHPDVFRYRCAFPPNKSVGSVWILEFYRKATFLVFLLVHSEDAPPPPLANG